MRNNDPGQMGQQMNFLGIWWASDVLTFQVNQGDPETGDPAQVAKYTCPWDPAPDTWYHLEFVRDDANFYIFIDGVSQPLTEVTAIGTKSVSPTFVDLNFSIGRYGDYDGFTSPSGSTHSACRPAFSDR